MQVNYSNIPSEQADFMGEVEEDIRQYELEKISDFKEEVKPLAEMLEESGLAHKIPTLYAMYQMRYSDIKVAVLRWLTAGK